MGERTTNNATTTTNKHQFRADYGTPPLKQLFAKRAVTFLEHQFFNIKISQRSANNQATPFGAALNDQGRSNKAAMHEILNVLAAESNMGGSGNDTGDQIWKKLYYCIRCGVDDETDDTTSKFTAGVSPQLRQPVEAALHHLKTCRGSDGNTTTATASYGGNKPEWATRLYSASMGVQPGTYQFAVLKLLSQCGGCLGGGGNGGGNGNGGTHKRLESLQLLNFQVQDYMWQRLVVSIATSSLLQHVQERYHVRDLAQTITAFGPKHFSPKKVSTSIRQGLGMDAAQCGFLIGVRPIIEYLATPFWHGISDRCLLKSHCEMYKYTNTDVFIHSFFIQSVI